METMHVILSTGTKNKDGTEIKKYLFNEIVHHDTEYKS